MGDWCKGNWRSFECPVLGADISTNDPKVCQNYKYWQDKPCGNENQIRCKAGNSGRRVQKEYWGVEGAKDQLGIETSCKDGSDLYRPIVKGEEPGSKTSQTNKNGYSNEDEHSGDDHNSFVEGEESSTPQVWKTRPVSENDFNISLGEEERSKYRKDSSTGLWMIPVTEETCQANDGFVCKVGFE